MTIKMLAATATLSLAAACGQAPGGIDPQQASVSESVTPSVPAPSTDDSPSPGNSPSPGKDRSPAPGNEGTAAISRDRAIQIAFDRIGGGKLDEVEHEFEDGRAAWKVRIVKDGIRYSVYIDKANGEIFRFRDEGRH
jgi:Peptidase propeptide and YPEB domain